MEESEKTEKKKYDFNVKIKQKSSRKRFSSSCEAHASHHPSNGPADESKGELK